MQLKTILNQVEPYQSFVYKKARWADPPTKTAIELEIAPRANSHALCSGCGSQAPGYDTLPERRFEFVPLWQIAVYFEKKVRGVPSRPFPSPSPSVASPAAAGPPNSMGQYGRHRQDARQAREFGGARGGERSMAEAEGNDARGENETGTGTFVASDWIGWTDCRGQ